MIQGFCRHQIGTGRTVGDARFIQDPDKHLVRLSEAMFAEELHGILETPLDRRPVDHAIVSDRQAECRDGRDNHKHRKSKEESTMRTHDHT